MSYNPVSGAAIQYVKSNGQVADGYYLKFYVANTTTPLSMATDSTGGTTLTKCKLNDKGYPISNPLDNDSIFIPHVNQAYRFVLYQNEADADANNTANADVNIAETPLLADAEDVVLHVDSIAGLPTTGLSGQRISVTGYHTGTTVGGGEFVWNASARHNGVTLFDPTRSAEIGTAAYYVDSGVDAACWERVGVEYLTPEMGGCVYGGTANQGVAFQKVLDNAGEIKITGENLYINQTVSIPENTHISGGSITLSDALGLIEAKNATDSSIINVGIFKSDALSTSIAIYGGGQSGGDTENFLIQNCKLTNLTNNTGANVASINNIGAQGTKVINNKIKTGHLAFLTKFFSSTNLEITGNEVSLVSSATVNNPELFKFEACNGVCSNNILSYEDNTSGPVLSAITFESGVFDFLCEGNTLKSGTNTNGYLIRIDNADSPSFPITGLSVKNNILIGDGIDKRGVYSGANANSGIEIEGNNFIGSSLFDSATGTIIKNNHISIGASATVSAISIFGDDKIVKGNTVSGGDQNLELNSNPSSLITNLTIDSNYFTKATNIPVWLKYLAGKNYFTNNIVDDTSTGGFKAVLCQEGNEARPADTTILAGNLIKTSQAYGFRINSMNGITAYDNNVNGATTGKYERATTDAVINDDSMGAMLLATPTQLNDITHPVNTRDKVTGKAYYVDTLNAPVFAEDGTAGGLWRDAAAVVRYTPV